ncbi:oligosaccharide flippase family protein [Schleiferiaceae bacterium]|nr:oligosaccharide flippase family protein [Schleiferiaceae bacterium]
MRFIALKGLKWTSIQQVGVQGLNYASVIALAYWVEPETHGFFAIAALAAGLAGVLGAMGLSEIIIKDVDADFQKKIPAYWSLVLIVAGALYALSCLFSLIVAWFYQDEFSFQEMFTTSLILSIIAPVGPLRAMMEALHSRKYDFKRISLVNLSSFFVGIIPVFILGYLDYDRLALGGKFLLPHLSYLLIGVFIYQLDFGLKWDKSILSKIKGFSTFYSLNNIVNYFLRNIDYVVLAKFFSASVLGQYVIAYKILLFPMKNITSTVTRVGMPILAKIGLAGNAFKRRYFSMLEGISLLTFPIMIFLAFNSELIVSITFSEKYDLLPMMISTLAIVGAIQSIVSPVGMLFYFKEKMQLMMFTNIISFAFVALAILLSSFSGNIFNVLVTYSLTYVLLVMPVSTLFIYKNYNFNFLDGFKAYSPYLGGSLLSAIVGYLAVLETSYLFNELVQLALSSLIFGSLYFAFLVLLDRSKFGPRFFHDYLVKLKLVR